MIILRGIGHLIGFTAVGATLFATFGGTYLGVIAFLTAIGVASSATVIGIPLGIAISILVGLLIAIPVIFKSKDITDHFIHSVIEREDGSIRN